METWRAVVGHEGLYEVSSTGDVRSVGHFVDLPNGRRWHGSRRLVRVVGGRAKNYLRVMLEAGNRRHAYVHHLVCEAFHGPRPEGLVACHKNDEGFDNRECNLYWGTDEDNQCDKAIQGFEGEDAPF